MQMSLRSAALFAIVVFSLLSLFLLIQHELHIALHMNQNPLDIPKVDILRDRQDHLKLLESILHQHEHEKINENEEQEHRPQRVVDATKVSNIDPVLLATDNDETQSATKSSVQVNSEDKSHEGIEDPRPEGGESEEHHEVPKPQEEVQLHSGHDTHQTEKRGQLICDGKEVDSEIIYWKIVPGDDEFESPITPHHDAHHEKYVTFEYDQGGWNNVRMGMECIVVAAHAMGRTLALPPPQHLYLLGKAHKDKHDKEEHDEMGFEDFFDVDLLKRHKGGHMITMKEFLEREAVTGNLKGGVLPPGNSSDVWGGALWAYVEKASDIHPAWYGRFLAFPDRADNWNLSADHKHPNTTARLKRFGGERLPVFYDEEMQRAKLIHFKARDETRILQHHYAFAFFADAKMQSFYKRFIRDYMRYKDSIQCSGAELVAAIRADALRDDPSSGGDFYALHIRRGDFQFKDVKLSASDILKNLKHLNGSAIIPPGSIVYLSTDDPDGVCLNCYVQRKPCESYSPPKPVGCPEDVSLSLYFNIHYNMLIRFSLDFMECLPRGWLEVAISQ